MDELTNSELTRQYLVELIELVKDGVPIVAEQAVQVRLLEDLFSIGICLIITVISIIILMILWKLYKHAKEDDSDEGMILCLLLTIASLGLTTGGLIGMGKSIKDYVCVKSAPQYYSVVEMVELGEKLK